LFSGAGQDYFFCFFDHTFKISKGETIIFVLIEGKDNFGLLAGMRVVQEIMLFLK
jgi:hypothetical protein